MFTRLHWSASCHAWLERLNSCGHNTSCLKDNAWPQHEFGISCPSLLCQAASSTPSHPGLLSSARHLLGSQRTLGAAQSERNCIQSLWINLKMPTLEQKRIRHLDRGFSSNSFLIPWGYRMNWVTLGTQGLLPAGRSYPRGQVFPFESPYTDVMGWLCLEA